MTATKAPNRLRELQAQRDNVAVQRATLGEEHAAAERAFAQARENRTAGTASVRDVSVAKLDLDQLTQDLAEKDNELQTIDGKIAEIEKEQEAKRLHGVRVRRVAELSAVGRQAFSDFQKGRRALNDVLSRTHGAFVRQVETQATIAETLRELMAEGRSLEDVVAEVAAAGGDLQACNVAFGMQHFPKGASVEHGVRPLTGFVAGTPLTVEKSPENTAAALVDAALRSMGVPLP